MSEISQKQLEANRENAKLGGVKTEEGKEASKMNAIKHGLLSSQTLIRGEDRNELTMLENNLNSQLNPVNQIEALLVDRIISGFWRLRRIIKIESSLMSLQSYDKISEVCCNSNEERETKEVGDMLNNNLLDRLLRYENSIEKSVFKAIHELGRFQAMSRSGQDVGPIVVEVGADNVN